MSVRRGLFRAWILISSLWLALVLIAAISVATTLDTRPTAEQFLSEEYEQAAFTVGVWFGFVSKYLLIAALPPAAIYAFGRAVIWVGEGFRQKPIN